MNFRQRYLPRLYHFICNIHACSAHIIGKYDFINHCQILHPLIRHSVQHSLICFLIDQYRLNIMFHCFIFQKINLVYNIMSFIDFQKEICYFFHNRFYRFAMSDFIIKWICINSRTNTFVWHTKVDSGHNGSIIFLTFYYSTFHILKFVWKIFFNILHDAFRKYFICSQADHLSSSFASPLSDDISPSFCIFCFYVYSLIQLA